MKKLIFVSTGRCGTTRITEILKEKLPDQFSVNHVMPFSRLANIVGNLMFYIGQSETVKRFLYNFIISKFAKNKDFICTDPLTSMIIPREYIDSKDVSIVHLERSPEAFATSMFNISRTKIKSFIAHNFIPLWQPGLFPLENLLNKNIKEKYKKISRFKNAYFLQHYSNNPNFVTITMEELFNSNFLNKSVKDFLKKEIHITTGDLKKKNKRIKKQKRNQI
jgi:hypothetical protein